MRGINQMSEAAHRRFVRHRLAAEIDPDNDELTGHEGAGETSRYAKGASLKVLAEAVSRLDTALIPRT
jgi:hypothetical protein